MGLETYRRKRDFGVTPEPAGSPAATGGRQFVVHKHAASRLHYDLRLELDGVLLSWAVPKGPSLDPRDRHLAVRVEDHPLEYGGFEGVIPKGEYGAGTVEIWDRGDWEPEGDPRKGLEKGDLKFMLHGERLKGSWVLVRMKGRPDEDDKNWLLIKHRDEFASEGDGAAILAEQTTSVATGRTMDEIAARGETLQVGPPEAPPDPAGLAGARRVSDVPRFVEPELCTLVTEPPDGEEWLHEIKFDGYRVSARLEGGRVAMFMRSGNDSTSDFGPLAAAIATLPASSAILDGEVVVELPDGTSSFQTLQQDLGSKRRDRLIYRVFDLVHLDGYDLSRVPLTQRKEALRRLLGGLDPASPVRYVDHLLGDGPAFRERSCSVGLEGIVSKRADSAYKPGARGTDWLKTKCTREEEFVIGGWTDPGGARTAFGALLLGVPGADGLRYAGKVGTGFDERLLASLGERLSGLATDEPPFGEGMERAPRAAHWVRPELRADVAFTEWTAAGELRHPSFKRLRLDLPGAPVAVVSKRRAKASAKASAVAPAKASAKASPTESVLGIPLSHPDRVMWPESGSTKLDLAEYYERVSEHMMPYVIHRPVSMVRCPGGVAAGSEAPRGPREGPCFFHKHPSDDFPGPFERITVEESQGPGIYLAVTEPASLVALAQMGVLEIHIWGARTSDVEHPDMMVFDLDPDTGLEWSRLAEAARLVRAVLKAVGLESFVKTTGGKGLHVVVPLQPHEDWAGVQRFARAVAEGVVSVAPEKYTSTMAKSKRSGRIFVDYLRNSRSATSVAPYSTRAGALPTVSVPLRWEELGGRIRSDTYSIQNLARRFSRIRTDPWEGYFEVRQTITAAMKRELGAS